MLKFSIVWLIIFPLQRRPSAVKTFAPDCYKLLSFDTSCVNPRLTWYTTQHPPVLSSLRGLILLICCQCATQRLKPHLQVSRYTSVTVPLNQQTLENGFRNLNWQSRAAVWECGDVTANVFSQIAMRKWEDYKQNDGGVLSCDFDEFIKASATKCRCVAMLL